MPFDKSVFLTRTLSAIVFVAVMLAGLLWNHWSFLLLFSIIHFGCWHEYLKLIEKIEKVDFNFPLRMGLMLSGFAGMLFFCGPVFHIDAFIIQEHFCLPLLIIGAIMVSLATILKSDLSMKAFGSAAWGWLYISVSMGAMMGIRQEGMTFNEDGLLKSDGGRIYPLILIASIWINDTMAYIVGSFIGKTPFSKISPKKTWEGTIGGALLCILAVTLIGYFAFHLNVYQLIIISLIAAVIGTLGDLLESKLKRKARVKDSGKMMPGHGGFMDRFDSLLLTTPFVWLYLQTTLHWMVKENNLPEIYQRPFWETSMHIMQHPCFEWIEGRLHQVFG